MTITASGQRVIMGYSSKTDQKKQHGNVGSSAGKRGKAGIDILKRFVQQRSRHASGNSSEPVKEYGNDAPNGVRRDLISLSDLNSRLWRSLSLEHGLDEILAAAMKLLCATRGNVQLIYDNTLRIVAQSGFSTPFLNAFSAVRADDDSACGRALRQREQIVIEDVEKDELFAPFRRIAREAGYRAVVSTPVLNWHGTPLGMVSVHFDSPHRPSLQQLAQLDQYIRQAGDFIQRFRTEQELRTSVEKIAPF